eukprot:gnl/Dysnectes_brevis/4634_a6318_500.p1 GENE.gnl/Dysnectes_brevis/4634_a6318_500~~gnl/Dysnectes_brevis/4634_a6318_500.p1  ORF type:complete len:1115 (-),score=216.99 gnl/Dysnectes_brevis/4634_a6318_500:75-3419(-)
MSYVENLKHIQCTDMHSVTPIVKDTSLPKCIVCKRTAISALSLSCPENHLICIKCKDKPINQCPECHTDCRIEPLSSLQKSQLSMLVHCPACSSHIPLLQVASHISADCPNASFKCSACTLTFTREELSKHAPKPCPLGCGELIPGCSGGLRGHIRAKHAKEVVKEWITTALTGRGCCPCMHCWQEMKAGELGAHERDCQQRIVVCPHTTGGVGQHQGSRTPGGGGCSWRGPRSSLPIHLKRCPEVSVPCPHKEFGCPEKLPRGAVDDHLAHCLYQPALCQWCRRKVARSRLAEHEQRECSDRLISCPGANLVPPCRWRGKRGELQRHLDTQCMVTLRPCPNASHGCTAHALRLDLEKHLRTCVVPCPRCHTKVTGAFSVHEEACAKSSRQCELVRLPPGKLNGIYIDPSTPCKALRIHTTRTNGGGSKGSIYSGIQSVRLKGEWDKGTWAWTMKVSMVHSVGIAATSVYSKDYAPGNRGGTIGMRFNGEILDSGTILGKAFRINASDFLMVILDLDERRVSWVKYAAPAMPMITKRLPAARCGRYTLNLALHNRSESVEILSARQLHNSDFTTVPCSNGCRWRNFSFLLQYHLDHSCPVSKIDCPLKCGASVPRKDLPLHYRSQCRAIACPGCGRAYPSLDALESQHLPCSAYEQGLGQWTEPYWRSPAPLKENRRVCYLLGHEMNVAILPRLSGDRSRSLYFGVHIWDVEWSGNGATIGVSHPGTRGTGPGAKTMDGSVGMHMDTLKIRETGVTVDHPLKSPAARRAFNPKKRVRVVLDLDALVVSWIDITSSSSSATKDAPIDSVAADGAWLTTELPESPPYVLAAGLRGKGCMVKILRVHYDHRRSMGWVSCRHSRSTPTCTWRGFRCLLDQHDCPHTLMQCPNHGCSFTVPKHALNEHLRSGCKQCTCSGCKAVVGTHAKLLEHNNVCKPFLSLLSNFSRPKGAPNSLVIDGGSIVNHATSGPPIAVRIRHPGLSTGVFQWVIGVVGHACLGVAKPGDSGSRPGWGDMPGSIGMSGTAGAVIVGSQWGKRGFKFGGPRGLGSHRSGDTVMLTLSFDDGTITWELLDARLISRGITTTEYLPRADSHCLLLSIGLWPKSRCTLQRCRRRQ